MPEVDEKRAALLGRTILVTRPAAQAAALAQGITAHGGRAVCCPLIEIAPTDDWAALDALAPQLAQLTMVVFISPNAVEFGLPRLLRGEPWPLAAGVRAAAIGPGTAAALQAAGVDDVIVPRQRFDSEALLALPPLQAERVAGRRVVILRGNGGRELLADTLQQRGARVECVSCYRRSPPRDIAALLALFGARRQDGKNTAGLDALTLSSSEGLRNLVDLLDAPCRQRLCELPIFVPHPRIAEEAARFGLRRVILTAPADAGLIEGLCNFRWFSHD